MTISTLRRPNASAKEPQIYAPAIIPKIHKYLISKSWMYVFKYMYWPIKIIEFSHPLDDVFSLRSHWADGNMKDMHITSISSLVLTKPHTTSNK